MESNENDTVDESDKSDLSAIFSEITSLNLSLLVLNSMILALVDTLIVGDELSMRFSTNLNKRSSELQEHIKDFTSEK